MIVHPKIGTESPLKIFIGDILSNTVSSQEWPFLVKHTQDLQLVFNLREYKRNSDHKVPSMYCSHLHRRTLFQPQLFHNVFFCSANFLLCGSIGDRANFYWNPQVQGSSETKEQIIQEATIFKKDHKLYPLLFVACLLVDKQCTSKQPIRHPDSFPY